MWSAVLSGEREFKETFLVGEYTERIFEMFKRLHGESEYRGRIWAESKPGVGSKFSFVYAKRPSRGQP